MLTLAGCPAGEPTIASHPLIRHAGRAPRAVKSKRTGMQVYELRLCSICTFEAYARNVPLQKEIVVGNMSKQNGSKSVPCDNCDKGIAILYCKNDGRFRPFSTTLTLVQLVGLLSLSSHLSGFCAPDGWFGFAAAFLCPKCDKKIHATNKVAQKHHRIPLEKCQWGPDGKLIDPDSQMDLMITPSINMSKGSPAGPSSWIDAGLDLDSSMSMLPGFGDDFGTGKLNMPSLWATSQDVPSTEFHDANMRDGRMQDGKTAPDCSQRGPSSFWDPEWYGVLPRLRSN
eukprot:scaffold1946_cov397-Prasinococcus_capsulatus_cf.AAC.1